MPGVDRPGPDNEGQTHYIGDPCPEGHWAALGGTRRSVEPPTGEKRLKFIRDFPSCADVADVRFLSATIAALRRERNEARAMRDRLGKALEECGGHDRLGKAHLARDGEVADWGDLVIDKPGCTFGLWLLTSDDDGDEDDEEAPRERDTECNCEYGSVLAAWREAKEQEDSMIGEVS